MRSLIGKSLTVPLSLLIASPAFAHRSTHCSSASGDLVFSSDAHGAHVVIFGASATPQDQARSSSERISSESPNYQLEFKNWSDVIEKIEDQFKSVERYLVDIEIKKTSSATPSTPAWNELDADMDGAIERRVFCEDGSAYSPVDL